MTEPLHTLQEAASENVTVVLVGNKSDHTQRQVKSQQGEILAKVKRLDKILIVCKCNVCLSISRMSFSPAGI